MLIHPWDTPQDPTQWRHFVQSQGFGQLIAAGVGRRRPVLTPTQFLLDQDTVVAHLARPNPIWPALAENSCAVLAVAGDWAYIPSAWKVVEPEDPALGIPTTYYAAVQLTGTVDIIDDPADKLAVLRQQLSALEPDGQHADPSVHSRQLTGIRGLRLHIEDVQAKFKYGGNADQTHRRAVAQRLATRRGPGDAAAHAHLRRGLAEEAPCP